MSTEYKKILSISEITHLIKEHLETAFGEVWVEGELSNVRSPASGHYYFTLKDETSQLRAVLFRYMGRQLKCELRDGMLFICHGRISLYEPRGDYQLIVDYLEPKGVGALQLAFEQLKEKLRGEGLFDPEHKKPIPFLPGRIGIVTSPTGAAIRDLLKVIGRRFPPMDILISPVRVQGEGAALEIAQAIGRLGRIGGIDVIIVTRGGGSLEDLWAFNEEIVARAIYACPVPVISAVGHEIDFTIADFVADLRAPTPSAAGELAVPEMAELLHRIAELSGRLRNRLGQLVVTEKRSLASLSSRMPDLRMRLSTRQLKVDDLRGRLTPRLLQLLRLHREVLKGVRSGLMMRNPRLAIAAAGKELSLTGQSLTDLIRRTLDRHEQAVRGYADGLNRLSPLNVLQRGYSITRQLPSGRVVRESRMVARGDRVSVRLFRGSITCTVENADE
jgi:exodeoxyribonuclease VII large subunit